MNKVYICIDLKSFYASVECVETFPQSSLKTSPNNFNDLILLFLCHLVIARQTQTSFKDIHTHIRAASVNICIGSGSAAAVTNDKRVHTVDRLHMHRLPDRTAFRVDACNCFQNLGRATFAMFSDKESISLPSYLPAHGVFVNDHAAQPEVRLTVLLIIGIHPRRKVL